MRRIKSFFIPLCLFLSSYLLRLGLISKGPFHFDALELAVNGQKTLQTLKLHYMHLPGSPFTVIIATLNLAIFRIFSIDDPVLVVNLMAVYFSSLCVLMIYLVAREVFSEITSVFASLFLLVFPPFLSVSVYGKDTAPALFFALLSIYFMLQYPKNKKTIFVIASGLSLGLCGSMRLADTLMIIPVFILLSMQVFPNKSSLLNLKRNDIKPFALFIFWVFLPLLIFYIPFIAKTGIGQILTRLNSPECAKFRGVFSPHLLIAINYAFMSLSSWGAIFSLLGLYVLFLRNRKMFYFFLSWFVVLFFYYGNVSDLAPRYLVVGLVPLVITSSYFFSELAQLSNLVKIMTIILFFVTLLWLFNNILPVVEFRHQNNLQADFAHWIANQTEKNAVIMAMDENIFIDYYAKRKTLWPPEVPITCDEQKIKNFFHNYLDKYLKDGVPIYITSSGLAYDPCQRFKYLLAEYYRIEPIGCRTNEDWHHSCLRLLLFKDCLFRIMKK